jgi:5-methylcytosine-specific restriction protein A
MEMTVGRRTVKVFVVGRVGHPSLLGDLASYLRVAAAFRAKPTSDMHALDQAVDGLLSQKQIDEPPGQKNPRRRRTGNGTYVFERDPQVKAYVLQAAKGVCELCGRPGPFTRKRKLYLEVHHVVQLAESGPDTPSNTVAICANCHRHLHLGDDADARRERLYKRVRRLQRHRRNQAV